MNERIITFTKKGLRILCFAMLGILAAGVFALIFAVAVKLLWNWIMPEILFKSIIYRHWGLLCWQGF